MCRGACELERFSAWAPHFLRFESGQAYRRAHGGCLGTDRRGRARQAAIDLGEPHAGCDPGVPEWGNPASVMARHREIGANGEN